MRKALIILAHLDDEDVAWLSDNGKVVTCEKDQQLVQKGIHIDAVFIILNGSFSVKLASDRVVARLASGDIVGEMSLIDRDPPSASVVADEVSQTLAISKVTLSKKLASDFEFASRFYRALAVVLSDRLRSTMNGLDKLEADSSSAGLQEIDEGVLDDIHIAGERMRRLLALVDLAKT